LDFHISKKPHVSEPEVAETASIKMHRAARKELMTLGENIRIARLRRRLTAEIVAQRSGTKRQTIAKIESGKPAIKIGTYVEVLQAPGLLRGWGVSTARLMNR
jgi:DNA-binding XRE family transcriptional regulator